MNTKAIGDPMKPIGVLGVGDLTEKVVRGLRRGGYSAPIYLSPRNFEKAEALAREFDCVVMADNQSVVDAAPILLVGIRPGDLEALARSVDISPEHQLVSVVAGVSRRELQRVFGSATSIRMMLSLAAETNNATVVLNPPNGEIEALFSSLGTLVLVEQEKQFELAARSGAPLSGATIAAVPFGGNRGSSYGPREQGTYAREFFTRVKTSYQAS